MTILCQLLCHRPLASSVTELCLGNEMLLEGLASLLDNAGRAGPGRACMDRSFRVACSGVACRVAASADSSALLPLTAVPPV